MRSLRYEDRMEHEELYVSQRDIRRYELLPKVLEGPLTLWEVAEALGVGLPAATRPVSPRHWVVEGDGGGRGEH